MCGVANMASSDAVFCTVERLPIKRANSSVKVVHLRPLQKYFLKSLGATKYVDFLTFK
jgi:hypothetical protein